MTTMALAVPYFELPWATGRKDRQAFKRWLAALLLFVLGAGAIIPMLPVPEVERATLEQLPPQLARIVMEKPEPPPPPPPPPKVEKKPEVKPKETPKPVVEKKPPPVEVEQPQVAEAKEKAAISGLLQFKDAFADMRETVDMSKLKETNAIQRGPGEATSLDRSLLTSRHSTRSSGVNVAALSRDTGGVALSARETTKVEAPEQVMGDGVVGKRATPTDGRQRSIEDVRRVFDSNKGAIFAIYNRALRSNPALQGKVILELVIEPSGRVVDVRVVATEINDDTVVAKIVNRIRLFDFGKRDVKTTTISYPVHFLPT